ncbi:MAG: hypothetical protein L6R48_01325 [Planctomycetes bacterium]|nr:hypothetical protein [Planctomycetota bacterium]
MANRKDVDPFAGLVDPVDIILAFHEPRPHNELIRYLPLQRPLASVYRDLSSSGVERLIDHVIATADSEHESRGEHLLIELAAYTTANLDRALLALIRQGEYYPGMAFCRAGDAVRDSLLTATETLNRHALHALAWVDHPSARERFAHWQKHPPDYLASLHVPTSSYAQIGGWQFESDGCARRLYLQTCRALIPATRGAASDSHACRIGITTGQPCPQCGRPLTDLMILDRNDQRLTSIPWPKRQLHVRTCLACTCYGSVFFSHSDGGHPAWLGEAIPQPPSQDGDWSPLPAGSLVLDVAERGVLHGASDILPDPLSQIGGLPAWVQDTGYLSCPTCAKAMTFIGQISVADVHQHGDGMYYALVCSACQVTGTAYQQT